MSGEHGHWLSHRKFRHWVAEAKSAHVELTRLGMLMDLGHTMHMQHQRPTGLFKVKVSAMHYLMSIQYNSHGNLIHQIGSQLLILQLIFQGSGGIQIVP